MKRFTAGFICAAVLLTNTIAFAETTETIQAVFGRVKLVVDGNEVDQETLLYNGTTYVPLRAAAEALGQDVNYDEAKKTAYIGYYTRPQLERITNDEESYYQVVTPKAPREISLGDTFESHNLEVTLGTEIDWHVIKNIYDKRNGATVFSIPITVKNLSRGENTMGMLYYTLYGPNGIELYNLSFYFENDIKNIGKMRSGATVEAYIYFPYNGNGNYYVEFLDLLGGEDLEVKFPVQK